MKVKVLSRNPEDYTRETKKDIHKVPRNYNPDLHLFEAPREYARALNAAKLERVFAKPFLASLEGHSDGVNTLAKHPSRLAVTLSGSYDGQVKLWDLPRRRCIRSINAHEGYVRGITFNPDGQHFFTRARKLDYVIAAASDENLVRFHENAHQCGDDKTVKQWRMGDDMEPVTKEEWDTPTNTILAKTILQGISHHWQDPVFATCGQQVDIWDESRTEPIRSFTWGVDSIHNVKFNPIETHLLGAMASDRSIMLYDMRGSNPLRKVILKLRTNTIAWNPMEAFIFTAACDDYNLYTFDMRRLDAPLNVHMDHVAAVLDVDYSPTGKEFVSGSIDKSLRIFPLGKGRSREVYHTKRMQRVVCVQWSQDDKYLLSGSDEMNIRLWKAHASEKLGVLKPREKEAFNYSGKLKEKFSQHPQIRRIIRHRHVPGPIYHATKEHRIIHASHKRKEANRRAHSKPGAVPHVPERRKHVVSQVK